jgi:hypothetical protein
MKRFEYVHPAGGNEFTSVKITPDELEEITETVGWCDVCKGILPAFYERYGFKKEKEVILMGREL